VWTWAGAGLTCVAAAPPDAGEPEPVEAVGAAPYLRGLESGEALRFEAGHDHPLRAGESLPSLHVPLRDPAGLCGVVCLERRRPFSAAESAAAAGPCDRVALVLEHLARRRAEAAVRERDAQLQSAERLQALGSLVRGVAHDFNNTLTAILGNVQLIAESLPDNPDVQRSAERALDAVGFGAALARQLLDFSRSVDDGPRPVGLNEVVSGIDQLLRTLLGDRRLLVLDLDPRPGTVRAEPSRLAQVVLNLALNARDALPDGGTVEVSTRREDSEDGPWVVLAVRDDGVGMPPELCGRIFEPLFTTKGSGGGTGLGLATVRRIVAEHGGRVTVESAPGAGSTFEIRLPRVD
jgi:signal transduction histidine kinase